MEDAAPGVPESVPPDPPTPPDPPAPSADPPSADPPRPAGPPPADPPSAEPLLTDALPEPPVLPPFDASAPPMSPPTPPPVHRDPPAAALGNASLLGVGYLLLGRRKLAATAVTVTVALTVLLVSVAAVWCEVLVAVWWAVCVAHGWWLGGPRAARRTSWAEANRRVLLRKRLVALSVTAAVLLTLALLRLDADLTGRDVAAARGRGDCAAVLDAQAGVWLGDRVADAPLSARGDTAAAACRRLGTAHDRLTTGLTGDTHALKAGFATLADVLAEPGNDHTVAATLDDFLHRLPAASAEDPCHGAEVTDWLRSRRPSHDVLDRSAVTARSTAPHALVGCGDRLMDEADAKQARSRYQQLLDQYPDDPLAGRAGNGVRKATLTIELTHVQDLLGYPAGTDTFGDSQPDYCAKPAKYSGAPAYGKGTNRALFYGNDEYTGKLPGSWKSEVPAHTTLVVCAGEDRNGTSVRTCAYENPLSEYLPIDVTFHRIAIPVKVYELRTGRLVSDRTLQINGTSCPATLHYPSYGPTDLGPPSDVYVDPTTSGIRSAFAPLIRH